MISVPLALPNVDEQPFSDTLVAAYAAFGGSIYRFSCGSCLMDKSPSGHVALSRTGMGRFRQLSQRDHWRIFRRRSQKFAALHSMCSTFGGIDWHGHRPFSPAEISRRGSFALDRSPPMGIAGSN